MTRIVAQSFGLWPYAREGGPVKTEEDRVDDHPPHGISETLAAILYLEKAVTDAGGSRCDTAASTGLARA